MSRAAGFIARLAGPAPRGEAALSAGTALLAGVALFAGAVLPATPCRAGASREMEYAAASDTLFLGPESAVARQKDYELIKRALAQHPDSYDLLWRGARAAWAIGDRLDESADSARLESLGLEALAWTKRAKELRPEGLEGQFWDGLAISVYSRGISIVRALFKGLGGQYEADMNFVIARDPGWAGGAAYRALGRYYYRLPRIKRDLGKSEMLLREALRYEPRRLRTRLYLADSLAAAGRPAEAAREYRFVLEQTPGPGDLNEVDSLRAMAQRGLEAVAPR